MGRGNNPELVYKKTPRPYFLRMRMRMRIGVGEIGGSEDLQPIVVNGQFALNVSTNWSK